MRFPHSSKVRVLASAVLLIVPLGLAACSSGETKPGATPSDCPTAPVDVVVSVDQWGDIVSQLGGGCAKVTTVLVSSAVDPHDYEPAPSDAAKFDGAQLVVINGGHYDEWADKLRAGSAPDAPVVNAVDIAEGTTEHDEGHDHGAGVNPHVWYQPATVTAVADAVTAQLGKLAPDAADYFEKRRATFDGTLKPYHELIDTLKKWGSGKRYAATENVFDPMAATVGLVDLTPQGYRTASANESEPSPADLDAFLRLLTDRGVDVLIYNVQTEGSVPEQIRAVAEKAFVPVVEVTETIPPQTLSFQDWQVNQLTALVKALGVAN